MFTKLRSWFKNLWTSRSERPSDDPIVCAEALRMVKEYEESVHARHQLSLVPPEETKPKSYENYGDYSYEAVLKYALEAGGHIDFNDAGQARWQPLTEKEPHHVTIQASTKKFLPQWEGEPIHNRRFNEDSCQIDTSPFRADELIDLFFDGRPGTAGANALQMTEATEKANAVLDKLHRRLPASIQKPSVRTQGPKPEVPEPPLITSYDMLKNFDGFMASPRNKVQAADLKKREEAMYAKERERSSKLPRMTERSAKKVQGPSEKISEKEEEKS